MGDALNKRLRMTGTAGPSQEAVLNLLVASGHLRDRIDQLCEQHGVSGAQYNVLRILRGAKAEGYARCEIAQRLIERAPDVTRLIDRLEQRGFVERDKSSEDRRRSVTRITGQGLRLLETMEPLLQEANGWIEERLSLKERKELSRMLEKLYSNED